LLRLIPLKSATAVGTHGQHNQRSIQEGCLFVGTDLPFGDYFVAGAAGVCSAAGAGAGVDVSAGLVSFGTKALSWQPMNDNDNNMRHDAISKDKLFFTFPSSLC
jgi:hypothetical protein